jgi:hypothetical protein
MPRCKALEILRSEAYLIVRRNDEGPARRQEERHRWAFFTSLLDHFLENLGDVLNLYDLIVLQG